MRDTLEYFTSGFWPFIVFCIIVGAIVRIVEEICDTIKKRK
jgi:hypothetical protein